MNDLYVQMGAADPLQPQQRPLPACREAPPPCWVGGRVSLAPRVRPQNACSHAMIQMGVQFSGTSVKVHKE